MSSGKSNNKFHGDIPSSPSESLKDNPQSHSNSPYFASGSSNNDFLPGSPDQFDLYNSSSRLQGIKDSTTTRLTPRERYDSRYPSRKGSRHTTPATQYLEPNFTRKKHHTSPREHQWTVFGQLMENEGQFRTSGNSAKRLPSTTINSRDSFTAPSSRRSYTVPSSRQSFVDNDPLMNIIQSPVTAELDSNLFHQKDSIATLDDNDDEGSDYDSDASVSTISSPLLDQILPTSTPKSSLLSYLSLEWVPSLPLLYRNIFKCALAYLIASLFTFNPYLSGLISDMTSYGPGERSPIPSGHMVATIAVYFNPAKTLGGMVQADLYILCGLVFSYCVCLASMSMFWWFEVRPGWEWVADVLVLLWIGTSMSVVAWTKVWMASPSFNTACSMTAITISVVLVKEGGLQTLLQVSFIVLCGAITSNFVCYVIWPQSATSNLQTNITKTLDSFSTVLGLLTDTFLLEDDGGRTYGHGRIERAVEGHQSSFLGLRKNLVEAKSEWGMWCAETQGDMCREKPYEDAVDSMNRLGQHLNGLRSGTRLQHELSRAGIGRKGPGGGGWLKGNGKGRMEDEEDEETALLKAAAEMFGDLVDDLGPPLKALSNTCTHSLKRLRESFIHSRSYTRRKAKGKAAFRPEEFMELIDGIERSLVRFESTSNHAVMRIYRRSDVRVSLVDGEGAADMSESVSGLSITTGKGVDNTILTTAGDHESVFLVYYFIFALQEFAAELVSLVDAMSRVYRVEQDRVRRDGWWKRAWSGSLKIMKSFFTCLRTRKARRERTGITRRFSAYIIPDNRNRRTHPSFPKVLPHAPNTVQTPSRRNLTFIGRVKQTLWTIGKRFGERDTKHAVKTGMAMCILSAPAFFDTTRPLFVEYWGDWALISFFVVMSPTIGATNYLSLHRVIGTLFGAAVAAGMYTLCPDDAVVLSIFGFFFSLPCFYYIVAKPQFTSAARFVLLTYNLTCLYCYNVREKDVSAVDVAFHRAIAVTIGVVWAALVSRFWWPSEARRELSKALGEFCLNIGWLYTRLVAANSYAPDSTDQHQGQSTISPTSSEESRLVVSTTKLNDSIKEFMAMELHLQIKLIELQGLLAQAQHEPRLKGPFPVQLYRSVLISLQTILDKLHSMRCVTTREEWYTSVRQDFIVPVNRERHEMVGNIILSFSTLASAFRLKAPLPPYLPPVEASRQRLVDAIRKLEIVKNRDVKGSKQLLFFAYALTMKGVTDELESLGSTLQNAFGVIGQTPEEFEALFLDADEARRRVDYAV